MARDDSKKKEESFSFPKFPKPKDKTISQFGEKEFGEKKKFNLDEKLLEEICDQLNKIHRTHFNRFQITPVFKVLFRRLVDEDLGLRTNLAELQSVVEIEKINKGMLKYLKDALNLYLRSIGINTWISELSFQDDTKTFIMKVEPYIFRKF